MLVSTSVDQLVKIWNFDTTSCTMVDSHHYKIGRIHCLQEVPENNWFVGLGGDKRKKNFTVANLLDLDSVKKAFTNEPITGESQEVKMEDEDND